MEQPRGVGGKARQEGRGPSGGSGADMDSFLAQVSRVKAMLANLRQRQRSLNDLHEKTRVATRAGEIASLREQMQDEMVQVSRAADIVQRDLKALDEAAQSADDAPMSAGQRTRASLIAALSRKLKEIYGEFSSLRTRVREEHKEVIERQLYTVTGERPVDKQIEQLIESGEAEQVFEKAILQQGKGHILDTLSEVQERHAAILSLERSLGDLQQAFVDMAVLVEAQGELVDNIANHIKQTVNYVHKGTQSLQAARRLQLNTRKWMCIGICIVLVIAVVIIVGAVQPWQ